MLLPPLRGDLRGVALDPPMDALPMEILQHSTLKQRCLVTCVVRLSKVLRGVDRVGGGSQLARNIMLRKLETTIFDLCKSWPIFKESDLRYCQRPDFFVHFG